MRESSDSRILKDTHHDKRKAVEGRGDCHTSVRWFAMTAFFMAMTDNRGTARQATICLTDA